MKKAFLLLIIILPLITMAQSVSIFSGFASGNNLMYGVEFKTGGAGMFIERYRPMKYLNIEKNNTPVLNGSFAFVDVIYDGVMIGCNFHVKALSNILLSAGIGLLNKQTIYFTNTQTVYNPNGSIQSKAGSKLISVDENQEFAFEFTCGKDFDINDKLIIGIKGGVNSRTNVIGTLSLGVKLN